MANKEQNKPSIIIVDNSVAITGALKAIVNATVPLAETFRFIYVLPENSTALPYLQRLGLSHETLPFVEISKSPANLIKYFPFLLLNGVRLKNLVQKHQARVIHMNDFYNLTGIVAKTLGAKVAIITHVRFLPQKFIPALAKIWSKLNLQYAYKLVCVSNAVKVYFSDSGNVTTIPDPLPETELHAPKEISEKEKARTELLYLSNFIRGKGQNFALEAFKKAYKQNEQLRLTFAGGDMGLEKNRDFKAELEEDVKANNLEQVVRFESFVEDVEARIKAADILLNFSESESFSLTCLDALFYGTPLIASDCGGPAELFENERSGYLVPNMDTEAMAKAIQKLAEDWERQRLFAREGKQFVRNKFNSGNTWQALGRLYKDAINSLK